MGFPSIFSKRINLVTCKVPIRSPLKQRICDWVHRRAILANFLFAWDQGVYLKMVRTQNRMASDLMFLSKIATFKYPSVSFQTQIFQAYKDRNEAFDPILVGTIKNT